MKEYTFYNRDLSWLSFNERVLMEAENERVPLLERIKFLSIYSSNLDEFYRVRMPVLMAIDNFDDRTGLYNSYFKAEFLINQQQERFGHLLANYILPALQQEQIHWLYHEDLPPFLEDQAAGVFFNEVLAYIRLFSVEKEDDGFFAENNKLYQAVMLSDGAGTERLELITVPSDVLPRFFVLSSGDVKYVVFLDDIIKSNLAYLFPGESITGVYNIKITRNAELNLQDEIDEDITAALEKELKKRDLGFATRFLCQPGIPLRHLYRIIYTLDLAKASVVQGGYYHNMKDLSGFPLQDAHLSYTRWPAHQSLFLKKDNTLFEQILKQDLMVHVPYQNYDPVLRFFNEAANDIFVEEIYVTLYRVADNSRIAHALITAAKNGKKVSVMVELKARFDEANNIKWAARMKAAGVKLIYSSADMKVHAKVALVKRTVRDESHYIGLLATGNLNESTARFYTDHILMTANQDMLSELQQLFGFLRKKKKKPLLEDAINFEHLLVAQFNLQQKFLSLIDREIDNARKGLPAGMIIKMNNLEEKVLISKLYEASNAGVKIEMIVRSVCCLIPGIAGQSENITIRRIVDRYLEHGRIFVFHNNGNKEVFMGSADWMNRNIYSRIEVCFPVYDTPLKARLIEMLTIQLNDTVQAVELNAELQNNYLSDEAGISSQQALYNLLREASTTQKLNTI
ncbi:polyphosphate kinase 1 [Pedobacter sp. MC2016-15]|uniref:polyphosphate kinase 1 n=1 Tax=Pedobacter sp. MC2016-15 TaxID=2994473 RepID=UPI0022460F42|nr:polyphosphate kinase 1 [Pedobacter sp. MC2016-15]MCX2479531.1 polyphosphate kinase 1 [Pedobacter sp. MC2016-15]